MPQPFEVISTDQKTGDLLREQAAKLEAMARSAAPRVAARYAWWNKIRGVAASYDVNIADHVGEDVAALNDAADASARKFATAYTALESGTAELVARKKGDTIAIGIAPKGSINALLHAWPVQPMVVVKGEEQVPWVSFDAWADLGNDLASRAAQANAEKRSELEPKARLIGGIRGRAALKMFEDADAAAKGDPRAILAKIASKVDARGNVAPPKPQPEPADDSDSTLGVPNTAWTAGAGLLFLLGLALWAAKRKAREASRSYRRAKGFVEEWLS